MADSLNTLPVQSEGRQPRGIVKVNGQVIPGWIDFEVDSNTFYRADTFRTRISLGAPGMPYAASDFGDVPALTPVEIYAGFPINPDQFDTSNLNQLIYGYVDEMEVDMAHNMVELSGRDLTSLLIDTKTTEKWTNQTSSQIATTLATRHGLTPAVTDTTTKVGKYYEIDHIRLTDKRSEWDLLTWLAREEQFVVFVRGQSLYFQPKPDPTQTTPYVLRWTPPSSDSASPQFNGMSVKFRRSLTLARDIIVTVHSWNMKNAQGFSQTVHATHNKFTVLAGAPQPTGDAQVFSYTIPGLSPEQALERAQKILAELTQHEMNLDARLPADNLLDVDGIVLVQGTGTAFDQAYYPDSIKRSMSKSEGYVMHIHAKNHSPESVVIA